MRVCANELILFRETHYTFRQNIGNVTPAVPVAARQCCYLILSNAGFRVFLNGHTSNVHADLHPQEDAYPSHLPHFAPHCSIALSKDEHTLKHLANCVLFKRIVYIKKLKKYQLLTVIFMHFKLRS